MTRFIMTIAESAHLVLQSASIAKGGEVFVTKMPVVKIADLAEAMIEIVAPRYGFGPSDIQIEIVGSRPGEKLYEELMSEEEVRRSLELKDMFVVTPAFKSVYGQILYVYPDIISQTCEKSYVSANEAPMSKDLIRQYLLDNKVITITEEITYGELV